MNGYVLVYLLGNTYMRVSVHIHLYVYVHLPVL